jgi:hypothetical protein
MSERSSRIVRRTIFAGCLTIAAGALFAVCGLCPTDVAAQALAVTPSTDSTLLALPNAPDAAMSDSSASVDVASANTSGTSGAAVTTTSGVVFVSPTQKFIRPGQVAPTLTAGNKVLLGVRDAYSPFSASGWFAVAGYEQVMNGSPNYGTDRGAFGQRLCAAAVRDSSESIFSESVMANFFHEDPRYYQMGPAHNFFVRLLYSGTRPIFTRSDSGRQSLNLASLSGTLGGSALTNLYYPQANRGPTQTMETFGGSIGGSALGDVVSEFYDSFTHMFRHRTN